MEERIQAAIAKARAARQDTRPAPSARRDVSRTGPLSPEIRNAVWDALPMHAPTRQCMEENRILDALKSAEISVFDVMRTRALQQMQANGWKRMAITSPTAGCGKSTVAINLGLSMTRRGDVSAILFEADMRRPSIAKKLGVTGRFAASKVLRGTEPFDKNAYRISDRLAVTSHTGPVANPADLLQSPQVGDVLREIEETFEPTIMIFDMPPLLINDDTIGFLQHMDCALLVAAAEHTSIEEIDNCERELSAHTNVLGVVLNKCRFSGRKYGYYY